MGQVLELRPVQPVLTAERKTLTLRIRITPSEHDRIFDAARVTKCPNMSEYARTVLVGDALARLAP